MAVFWDVKPWSLVNAAPIRRVRNIFLWNVCKYPPDKTMFHPRRQQTSLTGAVGNTTTIILSMIWRGTVNSCHFSSLFNSIANIVTIQLRLWIHVKTHYQHRPKHQNSQHKGMKYTYINNAMYLCINVCSTTYTVSDISSFQILRTFRCYFTLLRNLFCHYHYLNFLTSL